MKIVFLNTWNGKVAKELREFIKERCLAKTDIFCFQEVYPDNLSFFTNLLQNFTYEIVGKKCNEDDLSQLTAISKSIKNVETELIGINDISVGIGLCTIIVSKGTPLSICNFHGDPRPGNKLDSPNRLKQSQLVVDFYKNVSGPKVIGGDFNLELNTKSVSLLEEAGYTNLIKQYKIDTTRNHYAWDKYPDSPQFYSDYVFVSQEVRIRNFTVPKIDVSDHLPMILEIED